MSELLTKPSPHPRGRNPELTRSSDLICRKMMAKTRQLRYADARALLQDLHHCQVVGDSGLDGLEAATFEQDSIMARQQALDHGVVTGGASPVPPPATGKVSRPGPGPRAGDNGVFRAAALLVLLVTLATLLLAFVSLRHPLGRLDRSFAVLTHAFAAPRPAANVVTNETPAPAAPKPLPPPETAPVVTEEKTPVPSPSPPPVTSAPAVNPVAAIPVAPIASPAEAGPAAAIDTNVPGASIPAVPALAVGTNVPGAPIPAVPALPDSALEARVVAEDSLPRDLLGPDGHVPLLRIRGKHDPTQLVPTFWTFDFFDPHAAGHARIVSVSDHRVVDNGTRVTFIISPYTPANILPANIIDSSQALQIAQALIPGVPVSSSEFALSQEKNSAPFWTVTLWAHNPHGDEVELGAVTMLADKGDVISNTLRPDRLKD